MEIQSLRRLVEQGRYAVPPEQVAQAIIEWIDPLALTRGERFDPPVIPTARGPVPRGVSDPLQPRP